VTCFLRNPIVKLARQISALFCNDAMVATATLQVVLDLYQTFHTKLVGNSFSIFSAKNYPHQLVLAKLCQKIIGVHFLRHSVFIIIITAFSVLS